MKKIFTLLSAALMSLAVSAEDYTCHLAVEVFGEPALNNTTVDISLTENANGKYDLVLKDFYFGEMPVGDINIKDIVATPVEDEDLAGAAMLTFDGKITLGGNFTAFGELPTTLQGFKAGNNIGIRLQLPVAGVNVAAHNMQTQIYGADFENWHNAGSTYTGTEPNGWHSILSGTGLAMLSPSKTTSSDEVRPGSTGTTSAKVQSNVVFGISANGTITTGRMHVGAMDAKDPKNHVFIAGEGGDDDIFCENVQADARDPFVNTELTDGNGDPFFSALPAYPTSISLWYKFKNGGENTNPALISTYLVGEGYFQDPVPTADYVFENQVASANSELAATDEWKQVTVPFEYVKNSSADPEKILVTINTCNVPGGGSESDDDPDVLFVDDVTLNYEPVANEIEFYNGDKEESQGVVVNISEGKDTYDVTLASVPTDEDVEIYCDNEDAYALTTYDEATKVLTVNMYNAELKFIKTYKFNLTVSNGINGIESNGSQVVKSRYNVSGQKVGKNAHGLIITKYSDGRVVKSFK